jgi:DNA-binding transcriptional ArsR family regulator
MEEADPYVTEIPDESSEVYQQLLVYLEALGDSTRLKMLKDIDHGALDARALSRRTATSVENVTKHLKLLMTAGLVQKSLGDPPGERDRGRIVNIYTSKPGGIENVMRMLARFSNMQFPLTENIHLVEDQVLADFPHHFPQLRVLGGPDDGMTFYIRTDHVRIGRFDPRDTGKFDPATDIALPERYHSITRISHPHASIISKQGRFFIQDMRSRNGTFLNMEREKIPPERLLPLTDQAQIQLSYGPNGITLLFLLPSEPDMVG